MSNLMINQLNGGSPITATTLASSAVLPIQLPATASVPNLTVPMTVTQLASFVGSGAGFGNMALQNATTVAITGGSISGVTTLSSASSASFSTGSANFITISGGNVISTNAGALAIQPNTGVTNVLGSVNASALVAAFNSTVPPTGGTQGISVSSIGAFGIYFGSGTPTTSAAQGSLYLRTDGSSTSSRLYVNSNGATAWAAVTTAS